MSSKRLIIISKFCADKTVGVVHLGCHVHESLITSIIQSRHLHRFFFANCIVAAPSDYTACAKKSHDSIDKPLPTYALVQSYADVLTHSKLFVTQTDRTIPGNTHSSSVASINSLTSAPMQSCALPFQRYPISLFLSYSSRDSMLLNDCGSLSYSYINSFFFLGWTRALLACA